MNQLSQRLPHLPRRFDSLLCQNILAFAEVPYRPSRLWACRVFATEYATAADTWEHFPFPRTSNPSPWDIFHLEKDASQAEIKSRYFELVRLYHPDVCKARGLDPSLAESRFQAVTAAYHALRSGLGGSSHVDGEAEEIRNRLATWRSREQSRGSLVWMRRQRALRAEADAGKWWKSDRMLVYSLASVTLMVGAMHFSVRSPAQRNEQAKRYIELKTRQAQDRRLHRENIPQAQEDLS